MLLSDRLNLIKKIYNIILFVILPQLSLFRIYFVFWYEIETNFTCTISCRIRLFKAVKLTYSKAVSRPATLTVLTFIR